MKALIDEGFEMLDDYMTVYVTNVGSPFECEFERRTMHDGRCTIHDVRCTMYDVQWTMHDAKDALQQVRISDRSIETVALNGGLMVSEDLIADFEHQLVDTRDNQRAFASMLLNSEPAVSVVSVEL